MKYDFQRLKDWMDGVCQKKYTPCCDVMIYQDHKEVFRYLTGTTDLEGQHPVSPQTVYYLYSCTKPITAATGMILLERGLLHLDDPVAKYLPAYADAYVLQNGKQVRVGDQMTVKHLFTMSAGLDYTLDRPAVQQIIRENPDASTVEVVNTFVKEPLLFVPGDQFEYSLCHDVLGAVIEVAGQKTLGEVMKTLLFDPLGMSHTYFPKKNDVVPNLAPIYRYWGEQGMDIEPSNRYVFGARYQSGGAGLVSTTEDYALFGDCMACGGVGKSGARVMKEETVKQMRTEQLSGFVHHPAFNCSAGEGYGYGLGVRVLIDRSAGQRSHLGEFGWDGAAGAYLLCDPTCALSIVYMQHVQNWPEPLEFHKPVRDLTYDIMGL